MATTNKTGFLSVKQKISSTFKQTDVKDRLLDEMKINIVVKTIQVD